MCIFFNMYDTLEPLNVQRCQMEKWRKNRNVSNLYSYFFLYSRNPIYIADEVTAAAGNPAELKIALDKILLYLRIVHSIDFYNQVSTLQGLYRILFWLDIRKIFLPVSYKTVFLAGYPADEIGYKKAWYPVQP